jgi:hypothetical protein
MTEIALVELNQNLMSEWNAKNEVLDRYYVLVREHVIQY